jgi:hypothetical protein
MNWYMLGGIAASPILLALTIFVLRVVILIYSACFIITFKLCNLEKSKLYYVVETIHEKTCF